MLHRWMQQRPHHGSHSFLRFHEDDADECEKCVEDWAADYQAEMVAAGL